MEIEKTRNGVLYIICWDSKKTETFYNYCHSRNGCRHCGISKLNSLFAQEFYKDERLQGLNLVTGMGIILIKEENDC